MTTLTSFTTARALAACAQVRSGNSCGSGSIVGHWNGGSLVCSNYHVTGGIGKSVTCRFRHKGNDINVPGRVIVSGYSNTTLADWSLTHLPGFQDIPPVPMSTTKPKNAPHWTHGAPRCTWPLVTKQLRPTRIDANSKLILFTPDAIGGQSGSAVYDSAENIMRALIAWSWGGQTGAQQTAEIYRMTQAASVEVAGLRPDGLIPLTASDVEFEEGFHVLSDATGNIRIQDLPIWDTSVNPPADPEQPEDPKPEPNPPSGVFLPRALFLEYLVSMEALSSEFRKMLESGGDIPEEPIQPNNGNTFGL